MQHQLVGVALAKSYVFLYYVSTACSLEQRTTEYRQRQIVAQGLTKTKTKTCFLFLHFVVLFCFDKNNNKIFFVLWNKEQQNADNDKSLSLSVSPKISLG